MKKFDQYIQIYGLVIIAFSYISVLNSNKHDSNLVKISETGACIKHILPKYYATANQGKSEKDLDYKQLRINFGNYSDYEFQQYIGKGASGHAYLGLQKSTKNKVVIKTFKSLRWSSIKREIVFMQIVQGHDLISPLVDVIKNNNIVSLVYNRYIVFPTSQLIKTMTDNGNKLFLYQTLKALDYVHSKGVIHGDIKPGNIIANPNKKLFKLIDWGLSMYYVPGRPKNPSVGTKSYQSPEILLRYQYYDYQIDVYAVGFMFSQMIFKENNPFKGTKKLGKEKIQYIHRIARVFGTEGLKEVAKKMNSNFDFNDFPDYQPVNLNKFINSSNQQYCQSEALDLLQKMMHYDAKKRITPKDALKHQYFDSIRHQFE
ncbi:unnamed protein product [Paramecium sonneborni]|uniref:non-specific serine/threonine protein kinase n=1 Tax=Paramecium sonneborni TaxID=65129 RepID=A0A8S1KTC2_9CILI|nr:unnamed protein product [Paramecium sonneborni]